MYTIFLFLLNFREHALLLQMTHNPFVVGVKFLRRLQKNWQILSVYIVLATLLRLVCPSAKVFCHSACDLWYALMTFGLTKYALIFSKVNIFLVHDLTIGLLHVGFLKAQYDTYLRHCPLPSTSIFYKLLIEGSVIFCLWCSFIFLPCMFNLPALLCIQEKRKTSQNHVWRPLTGCAGPGSKLINPRSEDLMTSSCYRQCSWSPPFDCWACRRFTDVSRKCVPKRRHGDDDADSDCTSGTLTTGQLSERTVKKWEPWRIELFTLLLPSS